MNDENDHGCSLNHLNENGKVKEFISTTKLTFNVYRECSTKYGDLFLKLFQFSNYSSDDYS